MQKRQFRFRKKIAKRFFCKKPRDLKRTRGLVKPNFLGSLAGTGPRALSSVTRNLFRFVDLFSLGSVSEFRQGSKFQLSDPLFGHTEFLADLFEGAWLSTLA